MWTRLFMSRLLTNPDYFLFRTYLRRLLWSSDAVLPAGLGDILCGFGVHSPQKDDARTAPAAVHGESRNDADAAEAQRKKPDTSGAGESSSEDEGVASKSKAFSVDDSSGSRRR